MDSGDVLQLGSGKGHLYFKKDLMIPQRLLKTGKQVVIFLITYGSIVFLVLSVLIRALLLMRWYCQNPDFLEPDLEIEDSCWCVLVLINMLPCHNSSIFFV